MALDRTRVRGRRGHGRRGPPRKGPGGPPRKPAPSPPATAARRGQRAERREAILAAALEEFSARGFAATRLDDVAHRAGVAKGTIYLYFRDKESLFQELIRSQLTPFVDTIEAAFAHDLPARAVAQQAVELFVHEIYGTSRKDVIRLVISEGPRFPQLAEFYHREVLSRILGAIRGVLERAAKRGELRSKNLIRFPQLIGAPGILAIVWNGLFGAFDPVDVRAMMTAHLDLLFEGDDT
jgi:AcrR family transcriptional regulator